jgi:hypothetical protein
MRQEVFISGRSSVPQEVDLGFNIPERLSMVEAIKRLQNLGINFEQFTGLQLKVGPISYYPSTGTICPDGGRGFKRKGFDFFLELLRSRGLGK